MYAFVHLRIKKFLTRHYDGILLKKVKIGCFVRSLKSNIFAVGKYDTRRREVFGTTHEYKFISFNTDVRIDPVQLTIGNVNGK